jgi:hypothetical protein
MIDDELRKAMVDGVLLGVRQAVANAFNVYRQDCKDMTQQHRTEDGLIDIVLGLGGGLPHFWSYR